MADLKVSYDFDLRTIDVDVLVKENCEVIAAFFVIPHDGEEWEVTWTLVGDGNNHPTFDTDGIQILAKPDDLHVTHLTNSLHGPSWKVRFRNDCDSANAASYDINGDVGNPVPELFSLLKTPGHFHHDPSISVVSDPPAG